MIDHKIGDLDNEETMKWLLVKLEEISMDVTRCKSIKEIPKEYAAYDVILTHARLGEWVGLAEIHSQNPQIPLIVYNWEIGFTEGTDLVRTIDSYGKDPDFENVYFCSTSALVKTLEEIFKE